MARRLEARARSGYYGDVVASVHPGQRKSRLITVIPCDDSVDADTVSGDARA